MDTGFRHLGFAAKPSSNAFKNLSKEIQIGGVEVDNRTDTILRLHSPGSSISYFSTPKGTKRKWNMIDRSMAPENGSSLILGLGRSPSSSDSKGSSATACTTMSSAKDAEEESSMDLGLDFDLHLGNEISPTSKKSPNMTLNARVARPNLDLELSLSTGPADSYITSVTSGSTPFRSYFEMPLKKVSTSPSSHPKFGNTVSPLHIVNQASCKTDLNPIVQDISSSILNTPKSSVTCTSGVTHMQQNQRSTNAKMCQFEGCDKGARGASGFCIAHGGGRRCQKAGCHKGAEGRTVYCKAHGGGRRCQHLGCTKSAEGRTDYCIAHGGGRRCSHEGCSRAARGKSGLCIRHGGGKRCQMENCTKSAEGFSGFCISHGGGRRCQFPACSKGAQGSTMFCKAHGGGKRCTVPGCTKGAEGSTPYCKGHGGGKRCSFKGSGDEPCPKSVHGGTLFCVAHGGGKRCAVAECTKSARGRTDFCVRHGGGKRCKSDGCSKSAQGSTDFCKAHGGGKRCSWGQTGAEFGDNAAHCERFARGKTGLCAAHAALVQDKRVHGGGTMEPSVEDPKLYGNEKMKEVVTMEDMNVDFVIPGSLERNLVGWNGFDSKGYVHPAFYPAVGKVAPPPPPAGPVSLPEGRVHGGSLMALLASGTRLELNAEHQVRGSSEAGTSYMMTQNWM